MTLAERDKGGAAETDPPARSLPGRFGLPFIGETLALLGDVHGFLLQRVARYGPIFKTHLFGGPVVVFSGPEALAFFVQSDAFSRKGASLPNIERLLGEVLPMLDDPEHLRRRKVIMKGLSGEALDRAIPMMQRVIERYLARWEGLGEFTSRPESEAMSFEITYELLFGRPPDSMALKATLDEFLRGITALPMALPFTTFGRALKARDRLRAFVRAELATPGGLLEIFARTRDAEGGALGDAIDIEVVHFFFAAYSGLYVALLTLLQYLGQERQQRDRVAEEVQQVARAGPLMPEQVSRLAALERFTREIRRVHPFNPMTFFARVTRPVTYAGLSIPAGWRAVGALYATVQNPAVYPEPRRFDPDRFDARCPVFVRPEAFVTHGAGPADGHRCGGESLVTHLMVVTGALLLRDHAWELPEQDLGLTKDVFPTPRSGLRVRFFRRGNGEGGTTVAPRAPVSS